MFRRNKFTNRMEVDYNSILCIDEEYRIAKYIKNNKIETFKFPDGMTKEDILNIAEKFDTKIEFNLMEAVMESLRDNI